MGAIAHSVGPFAPSGSSLCSLCSVYLEYRSSPSLLPCLVDFIVNDFAPSGILAWLRAWLYRDAQGNYIVKDMSFLRLDLLNLEKIQLLLVITSERAQRAERVLSYLREKI